MFSFFFRRKDGKVEAKAETQRETLTRALGEVNALIALIDPKPAITIEPASGQISLALPEQMPDEALALPSPGAAPQAADSGMDNDAASDGEQNGETSAPGGS